MSEEQYDPRVGGAEKIIFRDGVTWTELVQPLADRYKIGFMFGSGFTHDKEGCRAMHELLTGMAQTLDLAVAQQNISALK